MEWLESLLIDLRQIETRGTCEHQRRVTANVKLILEIIDRQAEKEARAHSALHLQRGDES